MSNVCMRKRLVMAIGLFKPAGFHGVALLGCLLALGGCGGDPAPSKQPTSSGVPRIAPPPKRAELIEEPESERPPEPPAPPTKRPVGPWLEWQLAGGEVVEGKSYLNLIATPGYDSALQLASYDAPGHEDFPSLFIRAITPAKTLAELVGRKLPAQLYIAAEKDETVIHNLPVPPMELVITEIDGKNIRGTFAGRVYDVDSGGNAPISGKFQAIIE
jgi:hypothetical protein